MIVNPLFQVHFRICQHLVETGAMLTVLKLCLPVTSGTLRQTSGSSFHYS